MDTSGCMEAGMKLKDFAFRSLASVF